MWLVLCNQVIHCSLELRPCRQCKSKQSDLTPLSWYSHSKVLFSKTMWALRRVSPSEKWLFASGTKSFWHFQSCILTCTCAVWPANPFIQLLTAYLQSTAPQAPRKYSFLGETKAKPTSSSVSNRQALRRSLGKRPWSFPATNVPMISMAQKGEGAGKTPRQSFSMGDSSLL